MAVVAIITGGPRAVAFTWGLRAADIAAGASAIKAPGSNAADLTGGNIIGPVYKLRILFLGVFRGSTL
jgi:hypothetical protein